MEKKTIWQCHNPLCNAQYPEYVNGCPKCSTGEPGGSHKVSILDEYHPGYITMYIPDTMMENEYPIGGYAPGNYQCKCCSCGGGFLGDKRSVECEPCAITNRAKFDAFSPEEQETLIKSNIEIWNKMINESGK